MQESELLISTSLFSFHKKKGFRDGKRHWLESNPVHTAPFFVLSSLCCPGPKKDAGMVARAFCHHYTSFLYSFHNFFWFRHAKNVGIHYVSVGISVDCASASYIIEPEMAMYGHGH